MRAKRCERRLCEERAEARVPEDVQQKFGKESRFTIITIREQCSADYFVLYLNPSVPDLRGNKINSGKDDEIKE